MTDAVGTHLDHVLFVCTANRCRSPLAEALARARAASLPIQFDSAGLLPGGYPMPANGVAVAAELGLDLRDHVSRSIDYASAIEFDVVLTMTREQAREVVAAETTLWPRVFPVKQFTRWLAEHPRPADSDLREWLTEATAERSPTELVGFDPGDDVVDPLTSPPRIWRTIARELDGNIQTILSALYPA